MSLRGIARRLTEDGIPTRKRAEQWSPNVISGILKNPAYSGHAAYQKKKYSPRHRPNKLSRDHGMYPSRVYSSWQWRSQEDWIYVSVSAIVSKEVFDKVQGRLEENKRFSPRNSKNDYLLSGLLRCNDCGYRLHGKLSTPARWPKKFRYYRCVGLDGYRWHDGKKRCSGHPIRIEVLDELVWEEVKTLLQEPEVVLREYTKRSNKKRNIKLELDKLIAKKTKKFDREKLKKRDFLISINAGHFLERKSKTA